jgi:hypothetical protein
MHTLVRSSDRHHVTVAVCVEVVPSSVGALALTGRTIQVTWSILAEVSLLTLGVLLCAAGWAARVLGPALTEAGRAVLDETRLGGG